MAGLGKAVPKVPGFWQESFARLQGRSQASRRLLEPEALVAQGDRLGVDDVAEYSRQAADEFYNATRAAGGGDGPYRISVSSDRSPMASGLLSQTTPDEFFEQQVYGSAYPEARQSWLDADKLPPSHPFALGRRAHADLDRHLGRKVLQVQLDATPSPSERASFAIPALDYYQYGSDPSLSHMETLNHEARHVATDAGSRRPVAWEQQQDYANHIASLGISPEHAGAMARYVHHGMTPAELMANLGHMMGLEHGLTGKPILDREDRIRALHKWVQGKPNFTPAGSPYRSFGPDPVMQYGPKAGQPADGYERMRETLRRALLRLDKTQKQDVLKAMGPLGSVSPGKESYV